MNKITGIIIFIALLMVSTGYAVSEVIVLHLNYSNGNVSLIDKTVKYGFYPDNRYQADNGYRLASISYNNSKLYETTFKVPNLMYVDGNDKNSMITGGLIVLDSIDFALTIPYNKEMKEIKIYSPQEQNINSFNIGNNMIISGKNHTVWLMLISVIVLIGLILFTVKFRVKKK